MKINTQIKIENSLNLRCLTNNLYEIDSENDLLKIEYQSPDELLVIGECTNLVLPPKLNKIILKSKNRIIKNLSSNIYKVGSAVNWNDFVEKIIEDNRCGIENLIGIPGSVGAAPVQNIGAYGVQISDFIESINVFDLQEKSFINLSKEECEFGYRSSIFQKKPYFIIDVVFEFHNIEKLNTEYEGIQYIIESQSKDEKTLSSADLGLIIRELRDSKLPNPRKIPNVGSFFKNPIINEKNISYKNFSRDDLIIWDYDESSVKVGAGRLIELIKGNLKDKTIENLHLNHALVVTNKNNISYEDILDISSDIKDKVFDEFNIHLEIEPTVIQE
tara:strand:+ start:2703 stop:3695 length:993 start_codon:yes stop_codon:yes gene_type:complete